MLVKGATGGHLKIYNNGLLQDWNNYSALAMELLQSYTKPYIWALQTKSCYIFNIVSESYLPKYR